MRQPNQKTELKLADSEYHLVVENFLIKMVDRSLRERFFKLSISETLFLQLSILKLDLAH